MQNLLGDIKRKRLTWLKSDLNSDKTNVIADIAIIASEGFDDFKSMAHYMKAELDEKLSFGWNVFVGEKFGGKFKNRKGEFGYFKIGGTYFLVFNSYKVKK